MTRLQLYRPARDLSPFHSMWNLPEEISRLFWGLSQPRPESEDQIAEWTPAVDVYEDVEQFRLHAELPGLKREDVKISLKEGVLTLRGERQFEDEKKKDNYYRIERSYGSFVRSFTLPNTVDPEKIRATMKDGVLEIVIPKKPEAKPKEIKVEVS